MPNSTFVMHGFEIDLDRIYHAMWDQSEIEGDHRVFNGHKKGIVSMKRLLNELFGVPVRDSIHPINNAIRTRVRDQLAELGWARKVPGRSAKYVLYREL